MVKLKVQRNFNGLFILYYFFWHSEWRRGDCRRLLNYLEFSLASAHSNTFIPGKIYFSDLREQGQVLLQFIGTFLHSLIAFVSAAFCAFGILSSSVAVLYMKRFGSYLGLWGTELFSIPLLLFFFSGLFAFIGSASEQGQFKCLYVASPVLPVSVSVAAFTHLSSTSWVSCRLSRPLASASGKVWFGLGPVPSCVCWVVSTTFPACTQTMFYCRTCLWWKDCSNDIL